MDMDELTTLLRHWMDALGTPAVQIQLGIIVCAGLFGAWLYRYWTQRLTTLSDDSPDHWLRDFFLRGLSRIIFPFGMFLFMAVGRVILRKARIDIDLLESVMPLALSWATIRLAVFILRTSFNPTRTLKAWEGIISTTLWVAVALHLLGWLPDILNAMDEIAFHAGKVHISLLTVTKLVLAVASLLILALWLSNFIEKRLAGASGMDAGMRIGLAKFSRFLLLTFALLLSLYSAGIDLTALAVFGGALGVGLGFGLQRIASNFISGFILVMDRSIRPGDVITTGNTYGWVQEMRARYVVVHTRDGSDTLIPNEKLIISDVINWSYANPNMSVSLALRISYHDDPEYAMQIMLDLARDHTRVLSDPAPSCILKDFNDTGITLEMSVWINDPEAGITNVRSDLYVAIWKAFKKHGIMIPYAQKDAPALPAPPPAP
mgnify:FL=1